MRHSFRQRGGRAVFVVGLGLLSFGLPTRSLVAGPKDMKTNYPVGIDIGIALPGTTGGIFDTGGTTSLSYADAQIAGLIGPTGDPLTPPSGSSTIGGSGGGSVAVNVFDNVAIDVTPLDPNGYANGPPRTIHVSVVVAKKPDQQTGSTPAERSRKTQSLGNKIGKNAAALLDLKLIDTPTANPLKDNRGTEWTNASPGGPLPPPMWQIPIDPTVTGPGGAPVVHNVQIGSMTVSADLAGESATMVPASLAPLLGITPIGTVDLPRDTNSALFADGYLDTPPDENAGTVSMQYGLMTLVYPTIGGGSLSMGQVAAVINPDSSRIVLGGNALLPENYEGWFTDSAFNIRPIPEATLGAAIGAMGFALFARRSRRSRRDNSRRGDSIARKVARGA